MEDISGQSSTRGSLETETAKSRNQLIEASKNFIFLDLFHKKTTNNYENNQRPVLFGLLRQAKKYSSIL
jgi:hypothetical protein